MNYISLEEYLYIAGQLLRMDGSTIASIADLGLIDSALHAPRAGFGDVERYLTLEEKAAVLCHRVTKCHALPDGNKRMGFLCLEEFLARNGYELRVGEDDAVATVFALAAGDVTEAELAIWIAERIRPLNPG